MIRAAHILQLAVLALLGLGVLMVQSAAMSVHEAGSGGLLGMLLSRHMLYAALAVGAMLLASRLDLREVLRQRSWSNPLLLMLALSLALCGLTLVPGLGKSVNGASRWLQVGPVSFQPSELVKWVLVLAIAWWCARRRGVMHRFMDGLLPALLLLGLACGIVIIEDLGTAVLIGAVAVSLLLAGGARWWHLALMLPAAGSAMVGAVLHSPYRLERLTAFLDPWADPAGSGYHPIQSMLAFAQGGPMGAGLGNSIQKYYLPEDTTDFIFPVLCEELGLAGAATVVVLLLVILWTGLGIIRDCRNLFGRLVGLGVLLTVGLQAAINIAVVTVVVPTKGIALPLVSAGGTGWIMTAFALGLLASLDNARYLEEDAPAYEGDEIDDAEDAVDEEPPELIRLEPVAMS